MSEVTWTVSEPNGEMKKVSSKPKLSFRPAFKVNDKTPETQVAGANIFNEMRQRLIELGEMESR